MIREETGAHPPRLRDASARRSDAPSGQTRGAYACGAAAIATLGLLACGGTESQGSGIEVRFEYRESTAVDEEVVSQHSGCAALVGRTHIHPSWQGWRVFRLRPEGPTLWALTFTDVLPGPLAIRVSDANVCDENSTGAVTSRSVFANGVLLTRQVDTPGTGVEPGFAFRVDETGTVTP